MTKMTIKIAAVGDVHASRNSAGQLAPLFNEIADSDADILLLCGDITDYGLPEEARILVKELGRVARMPMLGVLGNHDWESNHVEEVCEILTKGGIRILDGDTYEHCGVGFCGVKGFGGGFDRRMLEPWGEPAIKAYVRESVDEALRLERGLAGLRTAQKVVLLHYAPIAATVAGEPCETFPFLGSSRFEEPINRYGVAVCFHGHAHIGSPVGHTREGVPVYNVSAPLLKKHYPDQSPVRYYELEIEPAAQRQSETAEAAAQSGNGSSSA